MARRNVNSPKRSGQIKPKIRIPNVKASNTQAYISRPRRPGKITPDGEPRKRSTVTFARLFANASATDAKYAPDVHILRLSRYVADDGFGVRTITLDEKPPRKWNQVVVAQDGLPICKTKHIFVSCNCPRFLFFYEVALNKRHASDILFSNGELPTTTNPRLIVSSCKHILTVMRWCRANRK